MSLTTRLFSLIVRNASSILDFYSLFFIPLVLLFYFFCF
ncbi:putative membrane protein [Helicobacter pylori Hp A-5]|nr:putative membrane protein [Helicobacter pylori Hp A-5]